MGGCKCRNNYINNTVGDPLIHGCQSCSTLNINKTHDGSGGCKCKAQHFEGIHPDSGLTACLKCPDLKANQIYSALSESCICKNNYSRNQITLDCDFCNDILLNSQGDGNQGCKCKNNYILQNSLCAFCNDALPNSKGDNNGGCMCKDTFGLNPQNMQ